MPKVYTLDELKTWTPERRLALYNNAKKHPDGQYIVDMIKDNGLSLSTGGLPYDNPVHIKIVDVCWSEEGKKAMVAAHDKGWPAVAGVDPILQRELGDQYGSHSQITMSAGAVVAEVMRFLGYRSTSEGKMPVDCVAKTGMRWK